MDSTPIVEEVKTTQPTPSKIMEIGTGFWPSKVLLSAVHFDLFTKLAAAGSMNAPAIKKELGLKCTDRNVYDFLDSLSTLGFLKREGLLETAIYSNAADTDTFLDKNKKSYVGGMLEMANNRLYRFWGNLEEALLTGEPQNEVKEGGNLFEALYSDQARLAEFIHAMSGIQMGNFMAFAQKFDFSNTKTLADIGGSGALLSLMVAKHQSQMECTSYDLPPVAPIANGIIAGFGLQDRVKTGNLDFFKDDFPTVDVIVMGNILHDWDEEQKLMLMKKAYNALPIGGRFVAIEGIIDDERNKNLFGMMVSLNMLIETGTGFDYTYADFRKWANETGFKETSLLPLAGPFSAAIAYK